MDEPENPHMKIRRRLYDVIAEEIKNFEGYEESIVGGFVLIVETRSPKPDDFEGIGPMFALTGFASDATAEGDPPPWVTRGYLYHALYDWEEMFMMEPDDEEDDNAS